MIIDAHQHAYWTGQKPADLVADMDANEISLAWLLTWEIRPQEHSDSYHRFLNPRNVRPDGTNAGITLQDELLALREYPDRFVLGYCSHPAIPGAAERLEQAHQMYGIRVCGEWKFRILLDDPRCLEVFRVAGKLAMPVVVHIDVPYFREPDGTQSYQPLWYGGTVANLERALQACPQTTFVGHGPGFWREISPDAGQSPGFYPTGPIAPGGPLVRLLETYPNLYADLSADSGMNALKRDLAHAKSFVARFHDRLLFARDRLGSDLNGFLQGLELSPEVASHIYAENALRLVPVDIR